MKRAILQNSKVVQIPKKNNKKDFIQLFIQSNNQSKKIKTSKAKKNSNNHSKKLNTRNKITQNENNFANNKTYNTRTLEHLPKRSYLNYGNINKLNFSNKSKDILLNKFNTHVLGEKKRYEKNSNRVLTQTCYYDDLIMNLLTNKTNSQPIYDNQVISIKKITTNNSRNNLKAKSSSISSKDKKSSKKKKYMDSGLENKINTMYYNQNIQFKKLKEFYKKEKEMNKIYSLFSFPSIKCSNKGTLIPTEYFNDFLSTFCSEEKKLEFKIIPNFMDSQEKINNKMRAIIVNWLIDVHNRFQLLHNTLFLSVIFFDRYISLVKNIKKEQLQLVGVTSLLISCKFEEIFSPEIRDFICIIDNSFEKEDLIKQENLMLKNLKFEVMFPSSLRYFEILRVEYNIEEKYYKHGHFLLELCLYDCRFSKYMQAVIATTVCYLLLKLYYNVSFKKFINKYILIKEEEIKECLIDICFLVYHINDSEYNAILKKYEKISIEIKDKIFQKILNEFQFH